MERRATEYYCPYTQSVTHLEKFFRIRASGFKRDLHSFTSSPFPLVIRQTNCFCFLACTPSKHSCLQIFLPSAIFRQTGRKRIIFAMVTTITYYYPISGTSLSWDFFWTYDPANHVFSAQKLAPDGVNCFAMVSLEIHFKRATKKW